MSSFVSRALGRALLPNLERDLTRTVQTQLEASAKLTDCFLPPAVYGFEKSLGAFGATPALARRGIQATKAPQPVVVWEKVHYPVPVEGLFR